MGDLVYGNFGSYGRFGDYVNQGLGSYGQFGAYGVQGEPVGYGITPIIAAALISAVPAVVGLLFTKGGRSGSSSTAAIQQAQAQAAEQQRQITAQLSASRQWMIGMAAIGGSLMLITLLIVILQAKRGRR